MKIDKFLDWDVDWGLTDVLTDVLTNDLTDVKCNVFVLCNLHAREMLLSFPAACVACCLPTCCHSVPLLCCTSATGGVM